MKLNERKAGVLMPISALPSKHGIGDFGHDAFHFVDLLKKGGYTLWQILPLNPLGYGHSPYQPFSSYAFDELYISLDLLAKKRLIEAVPPFHEHTEKVLYEEIKAYKRHFLWKAFEKEIAKNPRCLLSFMKKEPWVKDYGVFMAFKESEGLRSWDTWPEEKREWVNNKKPLRGAFLKQARFQIWLQKTLYEQWGALHEYANKKGIKIIGDIPFYVGFDSCDVWTHQNCFLLNQKTHEPEWIAGVPPDYFSETGQRWGNPIYDWDYLEKHDFDFLEERILRNAKIYDIIRLDHFRAFDTYWKIPSSCPTAIDGSWIEAPGYAFFDSLFKKKELPIIAEDLGDLRPEVLVLRDHYDFPGMNVVEFTFHDAEISGDEKKHALWNSLNSVCYLGTHDNDTILGYYNDLPEEEKELWDEAITKLELKGDTLPEKMIHYCLSKDCAYAVIALQDLLGLDSKSRINVPGIIDDVNWTWRLVSFKPLEEKIVRLGELNKEYHRR